VENAKFPKCPFIFSFALLFIFSGSIQMLFARDTSPR